jgi:hypothetical protein
VTRKGLKQLERELRNFNLPGLRDGKDRLPDLLKQKRPDALKPDALKPDALKPKGRKPKIGPDGLQQRLRKPQLRLPW